MELYKKRVELQQKQIKSATRKINTNKIGMTKNNGQVAIALSHNYSEKENLMPVPSFNYLIIDCSPFIFVDSVGAKAIKKVQNFNFG